MYSWIQQLLGKTFQIPTIVGGSDADPDPDPDPPREPVTFTEEHVNMLLGKITEATRRIAELEAQQNNDPPADPPTDPPENDPPDPPENDPPNDDKKSEKLKAQLLKEEKKRAALEKDKEEWTTRERTKSSRAAARDLLEEHGANVKPEAMKLAVTAFLQSDITVNHDDSNTATIEPKDLKKTIKQIVEAFAESHSYLCAPKGAGGPPGIKGKPPKSGDKDNFEPEPFMTTSEGLRAAEEHDRKQRENKQGR
jgi:hypothetical protein